MLDSMGREMPMSTIDVARVNASWAILSGLAWAFRFVPLFSGE
jgi:hypothetical protein